MSKRTSSPGPRLSEQLCHALYAASSALTRAYRPLLEPLDLTYPQFVVMMALWEEDGVTVSALAKTVRLSKPTMTPLLRRLEEKGFLERIVDSQDERQRCIRLTSKGAALSRAGAEAAQQALCVTGLDLTEAQQLQQQCFRLVAHLESVSKPTESRPR